MRVKASILTFAFCLLINAASLAAPKSENQRFTIRFSRNGPGYDLQHHSPKLPFTLTTRIRSEQTNQPFITAENVNDIHQKQGYLTAADVQKFKDPAERNRLKKEYWALVRAENLRKLHRQSSKIPATSVQPIQVVPAPAVSPTPVAAASPTPAATPAFGRVWPRKSFETLLASGWLVFWHWLQIYWGFIAAAIVLVLICFVLIRWPWDKNTGEPTAPGHNPLTENDEQTAPEPYEYGQRDRAPPAETRQVRTEEHAVSEESQETPAVTEQPTGTGPPGNPDSASEPVSSTHEVYTVHTRSERSEIIEDAEPPPTVAESKQDQERTGFRGVKNLIRRRKNTVKEEKMETRLPEKGTKAS